MAVDGKKMSVSSINFSRTSFTRNREAGNWTLVPHLILPDVLDSIGQSESDRIEGNSEGSFLFDAALFGKKWMRQLMRSCPNVPQF